MSGRCRFCGCSELQACPGGCSWANRQQTICSQCQAIAVAWDALPLSQRRPNMTCAFFRGFITATGDLRTSRFVIVTDADHTTNPYGEKGESSRYWSRGYAAGEQLAALLA